MYLAWGVNVDDGARVHVDGEKMIVAIRCEPSAFVRNSAESWWTNLKTCRNKYAMIDSMETWRRSRLLSLQCYNGPKSHGVWCTAECHVFFSFFISLRHGLPDVWVISG